MTTQNIILSQQTGESIQGSFGGLPVAERNSTYIAYFQSIGGTSPEIIDQSAYFISYLIDERGNISNPLSESSSLENLYQNFEIGKTAIASLELPTTNNSQLNGEYKITGIGSIQPIAYTETGSGILDYVTTMSFNYSDGNDIQQDAENFALEYNKESPQTSWPFNTFTGVTYPTSVFIPDSNNLTFDNNITASFVKGEDTGGTRIKLEFFIAANITLAPYFNIIEFEVGLFKNEIEIASVNIRRQSIINNGTWNASSTAFTEVNGVLPEGISIDGGNQAFSGNSPVYLKFNVNFGYSIEDGDTFNLKIRRIHNNASALNVFGGYVRTFQEYPPGDVFVEGVTGITQGSYYWTTGSNSNIGYTWITASNALSAFYGPEYSNQSPTESLDFGFSPISTPFQLFPGDIFRFEYNKNRYYTVTEVEDNFPPIKVKLVPKITGNLNLNHFSIYRLKKDGKYVILDVDKNSGGTPGGILRPKYLPKSFEDNYDNVLGILRDKGIFKDSLSLGDITE